jgi:DNA primase
VEPDIVLPGTFIPIISEKYYPWYAKWRKLDIKTCKKYKIGWCDGGYYRNRLIVPVYGLGGKLMTFIARWMSKDKNLGDTIKILYPKGSKKSEVVFNFKRAMKYSTIVITEGVFDSIRVGNNGIALLGKTASKKQLSILSRLADKRIVILLDGDALKDAHMLADSLSPICHDISIGILPVHLDPGKCTRSRIHSTINDAFPANFTGLLAQICSTI